jgi:hypothetical protein
MRYVVVDLKANRVVWIVSLSLCGWSRQDRADRQCCAKQDCCVLHIGLPFRRKEILAGAIAENATIHCVVYKQIPAEIAGVDRT